MKSVSWIKSRYYAIAKQLRAPKRHVRFAQTPQADANPYVECEGGKFFYVVWERGQEFERRATTDPDELLYWLVRNITRDMALEYELAHRIESEDFRRQYFRKDIELLESVDSKWAERMRQEYERILAEHPFDDRKG